MEEMLVKRYKISVIVKELKRWVYDLKISNRGLSLETMATTAKDQVSNVPSPSHSPFLIPQSHPQLCSRLPAALLPTSAPIQRDETDLLQPSLCPTNLSVLLQSCLTCQRSRPSLPGNMPAMQTRESGW